MPQVTAWSLLRGGTCIPRLPQRLDWFFKISNQRRQTRHAVDKKAGVELKPSLEDNEQRDFFAGANLLLLYLVTTRLGLAMRVFENNTTIELANTR